MTLYARWEKLSPIDPVDPTPTPEPTPTPAPSPELATNPKSDGEKTAPAIALKSNTSDDADAQNGEGEKTDEAQDAASEGVALTSGSAAVTSAGADTGAEDASASAQIPVWPFVGIDLGVLALILILFLGRRKREGEE